MNQRIQSKILRTVVFSAGITTAIFVAAIIAFILINGVPNFSRGLFALRYTSENASLFPALVNTFLITLLTLLMAVPVGIGGAVFLVEYSTPGSKIVKIIRVTTETLTGIPSIVFGLFGFLFYVTFLKWRFSLLAGAATLALMILPVIIRTTEEALLSVSNTFREASYALGVGKLRTIFKIVLPSALNGIMGGVVLSVGRIVGETAALIYTAGTVAQIPKSLFGSGRTLAVHLYSLWCEGLNTDAAYATAVVLLAFAGGLNLISYTIEKKVKK